MMSVMQPNYPYELSFVKLISIDAPIPMHCNAVQWLR